MSEAEKLNKDLEAAAAATEIVAANEGSAGTGVAEAVDTAVAESAVAAPAVEEESFQQLFEASLKEQSEIRRGEMFKAVVVGVNADVVVLDVGTKAEGAVPLSEFEQAGLPVPSVGDEIEALVQSVGGSAGVRLSVLAARQREAWSVLEAAQANETTVEGVVTAETKGGFRVNLNGLNAFMPRSEADTDIHVQAAALIGRPCMVTVLEARRKPENIVVSRRRPLMAKQEGKRTAFFEQHAVGDKVTGEIKRLADFGAFVDLGGVDALLHVSDVSWRRIKHPSEMLSVGQSVTVEIVKLNAETGKVSVSMKALQSDPWDNVEATYEPGMGLTGTVRRLLDFGAVVELEPGVEGMIHRSELSWTNRDVNPAAVLAEGDVVDVAVLDLDASARRIRLSLKAVTENPWQVWMADHPVGSHISGKIKNITDFGFFVHVADGMDGLVHMENLSWDQSASEALAAYQKGMEVECVVLGVDADQQRISLGIKQLSADPFELFLSGVKRGSSVNGTVVEVKPSGAVVELADGVQAFLAMREVPRDHAELKVGAEVEAKIVEVNSKRRQVSLSIRQHLIEEEREAVRNYSRQSAGDATPSALALELQRKLLGKV
ncbi:30S ribosomal protein S1 [Mariprofundus erugo]|uniref:30S ribosomal protein S1 n=1 Tax=Mariprofundus erugo TaxID=2528639 RepID=A0A5R9GII6_9PROT|nr:30S ribosomal protein S1 [Mariprofundus erugo]TLS66526.1 30S ribosomal protein S1 [Mariprofundus erugo]TLS77844.1 30S ribosomal protein S1 [Mariprofundus erugo]